MAVGGDRRTAARYPYAWVKVTAQGETEEVEALADTGFTGYLVVPRAFISGDRPPDGYTVLRVADGRRVRAPIYEGTVQVESSEPLDAVISALGNRSILGRSIIDQFLVTFDHGQQVIFEP